MKYRERSCRAAVARQQAGTVLAPTSVVPGLQNESHQPALHTVLNGLQAITYYQNQPTAHHFPCALGMHAQPTLHSTVPDHSAVYPDQDRPEQLALPESPHYGAADEPQPGYSTPVTGRLGTGQPLVRQPVAGQPVPGQHVRGQPMMGPLGTGQCVTRQPVTGQPLIGQTAISQPSSVRNGAAWNRTACSRSTFDASAWIFTHPPTTSCLG